MAEIGNADAGKGLGHGFSGNCLRVIVHPNVVHKRHSRPANHRQSILSLPDLTPDDIAEYFEKFTALRRRMYVARAGEVPPEEQHGAYDHVNELAAAG